VRAITILATWGVIVATAGVGGITAAGGAGAGVTDLPLANGATDRMAVLTPDAPPHAVLIMFTGGTGVLEIAPNGTIGEPGNFLVRTRDLWVARGFAVVIPDAPSNRPQGILGIRLSRAYADAISRMVAFAHTQLQAPVWLVGTSQGTIAGVAGATTLRHGEIAGLVLTSSITRSGPGTPETVFQVNLKTITVPTLILSNTDDQCPVTPPADGQRLKGAITQAKPVDLEFVSGGSMPKSTPCEAFSYHGYYGIEDQVVQRISDWIIQHP